MLFFGSIENRESRICKKILFTLVLLLKKMINLDIICYSDLTKIIFNILLKIQNKNKYSKYKRCMQIKKKEENITKVVSHPYQTLQGTYPIPVR